MRRAIWGSLGVLVTALALLAQESATPPYLEFIRGLRQRGFHDLAEQYSAQLRQRSDLPADVRDLLIVEEAETKLELARLATQENERRRLIEEARNVLEAFVAEKSKQKSPALAEACRQLAILFADEGHGKVAEIKYTANESLQHTLAKSAVENFDQADKLFIRAEALLEDRLKTRPALLVQYLETRLKHGRALLAKSNLQERYLQQQAEAGKTRDAAAKVFKAMSDFRSQHSLGWVGLAWYGESQKGLDEAERQKVFKFVLSSKVPLAFEAQGLVNYLLISDQYSPALAGENRRKLETQIENWLKQFAHPKSPLSQSREEQHLRLILALLLRKDLEEMKPPTRRGQQGQKLVTRIMNLLASDLQANPEFSSVARWLRFNTLRLSGRVTDRPIEELNTFEELLLRASIESDELRDKMRAIADPKTPKEQKEQLEKESKNHLAHLMVAARRAWQRTGPDVGPDDLENLVRYLAAAYFQQGDVYRAAVVLEYGARETRLSEATSRQLALAALDLYGQLIQQQGTDSAAVDADARQLRRIAELIVSRWPKAAEADIARFRLGFLYLAAGRYRDAVAQWESVSPNSRFYADACAEAGELYFRLHVTQMKQKPLGTRSPDLDKAISLLQSAVKAYEKNKPAENSPEQTRYFRAKFYLAQVLALVNKPKEVLGHLQVLLPRAVKNELPAGLPQGASGAVIILGLQSYIKLNDLDGARKLLQDLYSSGAEQQLGQGILPTLREMGTQLRERIRVLESQGPAAAQELEQTRGGFKAFLDNLSKDTKLPTEFRFWVINGYQSLGEYAAAAQLASQLRQEASSILKDPSVKKPQGKPDDSPQGAQEEAERNFALALYLEVDNLRLQARTLKTLKKEEKLANELFKKAEETLLQGMKEAKKLQKHPRYIALQILILQDQELYSGPGGAIVRWDRLRTALQPHLGRGGVIRQVYLDACYNLVYCKYQEARRLPEQQRGLALRRTAELLASFWEEPDLQPRFRQLLDDPEHKDLLEVWQQVQKARTASP